ncbi:hypothetical protein J7T55_010828 [Diaporthe amygdali]|uniref:uncharacterized protein n=1 Tax=Phomopsis amygdali TaxID=1214568 RepID=UPI0022FE4835|nr:uncharacterized protein J7T55_010828 [Diaporthe amygdali]KAJ0114439.1 hypothetical protein J7T55_010828 [Diaporthe amygdali]
MVPRGNIAGPLLPPLTTTMTSPVIRIASTPFPTFHLPWSSLVGSIRMACEFEMTIAFIFDTFGICLMEVVVRLTSQGKPISWEASWTSWLDLKNHFDYEWTRSNHPFPASLLVASPRQSWVLTGKFGTSSWSGRLDTRQFESPFHIERPIFDHVNEEHGVPPRGWLQVVPRLERKARRNCLDKLSRGRRVPSHPGPRNQRAEVLRTFFRQAVAPCSHVFKQPSSKMPAVIKEFAGLLARFKQFVRPSRGTGVPAGDDSCLPEEGVPISLFLWQDDDPSVPPPPPPYVPPSSSSLPPSPPPPSPLPKKRAAVAVARPAKKPKKI